MTKEIKITTKENGDYDFRKHIIICKILTHTIPAYNLIYPRDKMSGMVWPVFTWQDFVDKGEHHYLANDFNDKQMKLWQETKRLVDSTLNSLLDEFRTMHEIEADDALEEASTQDFEGEIYDIEAFNNNKAKVDYWAKQSSWDLEQGSALLLDIEPSKNLHEALLKRELQKCSKKARAYKAIYETLERDYSNYLSTDIYSENPPPQYIQWAKDHGFTIPNELEQAVMSFPHLWEDKNDKIRELQQKIKNLEEAATQPLLPAKEKINSKLENSYKRTVYSLLTLHYGIGNNWVPKTLADEIINDLAIQGLSVDLGDETLAKIIKWAKEKMIEDDFLMPNS